MPSRELRSAAAGPRTRSNRTSISYREPSTDEDIDEDETESEEEEDEEDEERRTPAKVSRERQRTRRKRRRSRSPVPHPRKSRRDVNRHKVALETVKHVDNGPIPPWATLPYQILLQIFHYAATPLYDPNTFLPTSSISWLLNTSRLCHAFLEPALTVLYTSPPLLLMDRAHGLAELLRLSPDTLVFNYRNKIERLQLEIHRTASYTMHGVGLLDVASMVKHCPRLVDLELFHEKDMSPYRALDVPVKWTYPDALFDAIDNSIEGEPLRLRSWRWSSRMAGRDRPVEMLQEIHQRPGFRGLRKISFINYQVRLVKEDEPDPGHENAIATSLAVLPHLQHLVIESSTLVNSKLLFLLPTQLQHLEFINCWEVTADDMAAFLVTHGHNLRTLVLNHNQSLSLSFLPILGSACPNLAVLRMNLTYYNIHSSYHDSEPEYEQLLLPHEVPTWPASLQTIELSQLRKWDIETAEMFLQSIIDSSASLPLLRRLSLKVILNIAWRDRSSFRDRWEGTIQKVFKRRCRLPNPWTSVVKKVEEADATNANITPETPRSPNTRRSSRVAARTLESQISLSPEPVKTSRRRKSGEEAVASRRSQRLIQAEEEKQHAELSTTEDEIEITSSKDDGKKKTVHIQGMCDVVDVRIDNLRPREELYTEAQFLDSEPDDDDDWDGSAEVRNDGYAW